MGSKTELKASHRDLDLKRKESPIKILEMSREPEEPHSSPAYLAANEDSAILISAL